MSPGRALGTLRNFDTLISRFALTKDASSDNFQRRSPTKVITHKNDILKRYKDITWHVHVSPFKVRKRNV